MKGGGGEPRFGRTIRGRRGKIRDEGDGEGEEKGGV